jgi:hypothetical protein
MRARSGAWHARDVPAPWVRCATALFVALLALAAASGPVRAGRVFVLADDRGQSRPYAAYREAPWPAAEAEAEEFARIDGALSADRDLGVMMIAPDREALRRAERALSLHLRQVARRLAIRLQVGPLAPGVLYGHPER